MAGAFRVLQRGPTLGLHALGASSRVAPLFALAGLLSFACTPTPVGDGSGNPNIRDGAAPLDASEDAQRSSDSAGTADAPDAGEVLDAQVDDADAAPSRGCSVAKAGSSGVALRGPLLTPTGPSNGEVFIDARGKIACVAPTCSAAPAYSDATILECPRTVIAPGLINAHVHLDYSSAPPSVHGTVRWQHRNGWRKGTGGEPILEPAPMRSTDLATNAASELRHVLAGVTTVSGSGGVLGLARNLASTGDEAELSTLGGPPVLFDTFPLGDGNGVELASGCAYPSIRSPTTAFAGDGWYSPHVAEGINGPARNELVCLQGTLVTNHTAIIHAVGIDAHDVATIRGAGASVIWSPRSNMDLYGNTTPITELTRAGVPLALGTDWLPTGSMNLLRELACVQSLADKYFPDAFSAKARIEMVTAGAARALGWDAWIGSLAPGLAGDVAVFDAARAASYDAILDAGVEDVLLVLKAGKPLYGDASLVDALTRGCEPLAVCGTNKEVCIDVSGISLSNVLSAAAASYPLFFCRGETPSSEPSCIPYRDSYPNGTSATDRDGDGVIDAQDDCPSVFNPIRALDGPVQSDVDGDGLGDACDPSPLGDTN